MPICKEFLRVSISNIRQILIENGLVKETIEPPGIEPGIEQGELFPVNEQIQQLEFEFPENINTGGEKEKVTVEKEAVCDRPPPAKPLSAYSQGQREYLCRLEQGLFSIYSGGLLFAPFLERYQFLPSINKVFGSQQQEGYSLDELCLTLFYYDLFRFQSVEDFKTVYPEEFGILLGLSSSPSSRTLRRFLMKVRERNKAKELIDEFAKEYLRTGLAEWGVLYIDGHFSPYHGICPVSKGWHAVRRVPTARQS